MYEPTIMDQMAITLFFITMIAMLTMTVVLIVLIIAKLVMAHNIDKLKSDLRSKGYNEEQITEISEEVWDKIGKVRTIYGDF